MISCFFLDADDAVGNPTTEESTFHRKAAVNVSSFPFFCLFSAAMWHRERVLMDAAD